jgi:hypothetical protein
VSDYATQLKQYQRLKARLIHEVYGDGDYLGTERALDDLVLSLLALRERALSLAAEAEGMREYARACIGNTNVAVLGEKVIAAGRLR